MSLTHLPHFDKSTLDSMQARLDKIASVRLLRKEHISGACNESGDWECGLVRFIRTMWSILEPSEPFVAGWAFNAICAHLEAVSRGEITRLLVNVPPGFSKSTCLNIWWPIYEWYVLNRPQLRYVSFSYAAHLTRRDNRRMLRVLHDPWFKEVWGDYRGFTLDKDGEELIANDQTGFKLATSVGGVGTGERGNRVLIDDAHNISESESNVVRSGTVRWFCEAASNRLNNMVKDAIIVIGQRTHEDDVSGAIIADPDGMGYCHLLIAMEYEESGPWPSRNTIGWEDPRSKNGELAWPERYPASSLAQFKKQPYMWSCQYMQNPEPRGGAIIKRDWWRVWQPDEIGDDCPDCGSGDTQHLEGRGLLFECQVCKNKFRGKPGMYPPCSFILASLDTAYTEKERNDPSAMTVWGIFRHPKTNEGGVILMDAWRKWLKLRGENIQRDEGESEAAWRHRAEPEWGLTEWVWHTCRKFKVDHLLIESAASGLSLQQELQRQHGKELWVTEMIRPESSKEARLHSVQGIFSQGLVWAPNRWWANTLVMEEISKFPFSKHKDLTDTTSMALRRLRDMGLLKFEDERLYEAQEEMRYRPKQQALYPV